MELIEIDTQEQFDEIKKRISSTSIKISRIPEKDKTEFMEIAREEFADDYGFALREMKNVWKGVFISPNADLESKINFLAEEINKLKEEIKSLRETKKPIRMVSGIEIKR